MNSAIRSLAIWIIPISGFGQSFGNVEIRTSAPNTVAQMRSRFSGGRYELENASMVDLIRTAWGVEANAVLGGPDWLGTERMDVVVTAAAGSSPEALGLMLRALLVDRFHVAVHQSKRDVPAFALTVGKKHTLKQSSGTEAAGCPSRQALNAVVSACSNLSMTAFAKDLPKIAGASAYLFNYPVVDRTGLKGRWSFDFKWTARRIVQKGEDISLFEALQNQLGLKLSLVKVPATVFVVDSVERPRVTERFPAASMKFDVATIKPSQRALGSVVAIEPGGKVNIGMTLKGLIQEAWGDLNPQRIVGGPKSADSSNWVIEARGAARENSPPGMNAGMWNGMDLHSMRMMLRALLVDRFKLEAHIEEREVSGYALVAAKPKLRKADPANRPGCKDGPGADGKDPRTANSAASKLTTCLNVTLTQFAEALSAWSPEDTILFGFPPVADATGIEGKYDITVNFTPPRVIEVVAATREDRSEPDRTISIFDALKDQLGLKLESRKVRTQVLVIDHVDEVPSEN
jgi:uncharacterized protein (TIGR03435 family)